MITHEDITRVKGLGCLRDKTTEDCFNVRVITRNGKITAEESRAIADAAVKYGSGEIAVTTRQTIEIQRVPYDKIDSLIKDLAKSGLETGGTGPKVRPIVSCKGTTCVFGLIDTFSISREIHERFYKGYHGVKLPHKFKIAVGGCPNNCVKPDINDLGIVGQRIFTPNTELCRGCKVCGVAKACPMGAASVVDSKLSVDPAICNSCGRCASKCPFGVTADGGEGYKVYLGGRWGKKCARGIPLSKSFVDQEELFSVVERTILFLKKYGITGERFADTISRIGFGETERIILSDELLLEKDKILSGEA
jgi:dissimilatory sulfite reductase (desulfoviridin) alpha/beta subunit